MKKQIVVGLKLFGLSVALILLAVGSSATAQKIVTVCPTGCDYKEILKAILEEPAGSTILVKTGTYKGSLRIEKGLTLEGDGPGKTILEGGINIFTGRAAIVVTGFTIKGQGIQVMDSSAVTLQNNEVIESGGDGLMIMERALVAVRGTTIQRSRGSGVVVALGSKAVLSANEVVANGGDGISVIASQAILMDNMIAANRGCGIRADTDSQLSGAGNRGGGVLVPKDFKTIQEAINAWPVAGREQNSSGDACGEKIPPGLISGGIGAIVIAPGTYREMLNISLKSVALQGSGRERTFLDGSGLGMGPGITITGGAQVTIEGLSIDNFRGNGLHIRGAGVTVQKSQLRRNWGSGLYIEMAATARILSNIISENQDYGIYAEQLSYVVECRDNIVKDNRKDDYYPPELRQKCSEGR